MTDLQERAATLAREVRTRLEEGDVAGILRLVEGLHPADVARVMERLDRFEQNFLLDALEPKAASQVLVELEEPTREDVLEDISEERLPTLVSRMDSDDAADVLGELDEQKRRRVLARITPPSRAEAQELLRFPEDTAGGIMALEVPWVRVTHTVRRAIEMVRLHHREMKDIPLIFVVDRDHRLQGYVKPVDLLLADPESPVAAIMQRDIPAVTPEMDQEDVAALARRYDLVALPVVDRTGRLLGMITYDDIFDVIEEEDEEDLSYMAGTGEDEPAERSALKAVRQRGPWLLVALVGGVANANVIASFQGSLANRIEVLFFLPVIMGMAGNVAIQASSLVVRGLATGTFALRGVPVVLWRETRVSVTLGLGLGALLAAAAFVMEGDTRVSLAVLTALGLVAVTAALGGTLIPLGLKRLGIDPAVSMGPFITTLNDLTSVTIYLVIVTVLLGR